MASKLVKSAARTLDILDLLADFPEGLTLSDMAQMLDIPLSSLYALITTLAEKNYVVRKKSSQRYQPGPGLLRMATSLLGNNDLIAVADPIMERLCQATSETTSLAVLQGEEVVFVHKCPGQGIVQVVNPVGTRLPSHATGSGKVMLAYLDDEELEEIFLQEELSRLTPSTITSKPELKEILAEVRRTGYAYDNEESVIGVWAVASCIRDRQGCQVAALSIVAPTPRLQTKDYSNWHQLVLEGATEISNTLGLGHHIPSTLRGRLSPKGQDR